MSHNEYTALPINCCCQGLVRIGATAVLRQCTIRPPEVAASQFMAVTARVSADSFSADKVI